MAEIYDLIVVGGGASGMMAAGRAGERGLRVLLLEKNKKLGEKLRISGGGRCNITNAEQDEKVLLKKFGKAEQFLYSLFSQFGVKETFSFFELRKLPLVVEANNRVFPKSQKAEDVVAILDNYMKEGNVHAITHSPVTKILSKNSSITSVVCGTNEYFAKEYLFATGSVSHKETGSTGDGFKWLTSLGHSIQEPTPTVVPLAIKEEWVKSLAGISLDGIKIQFFTIDGEASSLRKKRQFSLQGKILFTHFGISGPLILNNAYKVANLLHDGQVTATIDIFPLLNEGDLEKKIISIFDSHKNKALKNVIKDFVPEGAHKGVTVLLLDILDIGKKIHSITKEERKIIVRFLKVLPLTVEGLMGFDRAVVADGGLPLTEVDLRTMRSKKINNLLVTGDLLHINRPSGGYSLQLCWSTGYVAGSSAGKK